VIDWLLRRASRHVLSAASPLVPLLGDSPAARGRRDGLDPQLAAMLALAHAVRFPTIDTMAPPRARVFAARGLAAFDAALQPMAAIIDTAVPGSDDPDGPPAIPVRIYRPHRAGTAMLVWFHGGGGVIGSIDSADVWVRLLAHETRCTVASIDYRLGPEHPHPAAIDDAIAAWAWTCAPEVGAALGIDRLAVGGDSFGGFLAARVAAHAAAAGPRPLALQVLVYPIVDLTLAAAETSPHLDGFLLTGALMRWFQSHYTPDPTTRRPASPMFFPHLGGQAPAIVTTAGFDPLAGEGDAYAERLIAAGVAVDHRRHASLIHGHISMTGAVTAARAAADELFAAIRARLTA
jgi:acetyl esterase